MFDNDQPCLGDAFESMDQMREKLCDIMEDANSSIIRDTWNELWDLSLTRRKMLQSPLHSIAFLLNPKWFHKKPSSDVEVMQIQNTFISRCYDRDYRTALRLELGKFLRFEGHFANEDCAYNKEKLGPIDFGCNMVTSSSACGRNLSEYAFIHLAKRNRLGIQKAQDLVFVHSTPAISTTTRVPNRIH